MDEDGPTVTKHGVDVRTTEPEDELGALETPASEGKVALIPALRRLALPSQFETA